MYRFGLWVVASIVLSVNVWGQASSQAGQTPAAPASTAGAADSGKKSSSGKHHHEHHHHHKKQAESKQ